MSYHLYLDDIRNPKDSLAWCKEQPLVEWTIVRNYKEFTDTVNKNGVPANVAFDNDLSDFDAANAMNPKEFTGYDCAKWLVEYCMDNKAKFPNYTVHSLNPVGKENIIKFIEGYKIAVERNS